MSGVHRNLARLTSPEIRDLPKKDGVLLLPIGAIEQHGAHLPVLTDTCQVTELLGRALEALPDDTVAWALPAINYGKSNEHMGFAGTFSLSASTLTAVLMDLAQSAKDSGFRRLAFINGHGGNMAVLDAAARDIRAATNLMTFCIHPHVFVSAPFEITDAERKFGFHAGELETSLMLTLAPDTVHMEHAVKHFAPFPEADPLFFFGNASSAWLTRDWSSSGVFGDATIGTSEKGEAILKSSVPRLAHLIEVISTFEVAHPRA